MYLPFPLRTYQQRLDRVRRRMAEDRLDVLVVTMPDAVHWVSGVSSVGYLWPQALVVPREGEVCYVTRTTEEAGVDALSWVTDQRLYDIAVESPVEKISATVEEHCARLGRRVGVELDAFTLVPSVWESLRTLLPETTWVDASLLVPEVRLVKEPAEVAYQRQAAAIADAAMQEVLASLEVGMSETEVAGLASYALGRAGSEFAAIPPMVVSGERTALVHALATQRSLAVGDLVCIEFAGVVNRYHAVLMRTAVIGEPSPEVQADADCLERAMGAALDAVAPGVAVEAPDDACNAVLAERDLVRRRCHRIGYSLGVAYPPGWLEPMTLVAGDEHVFEPDQTFTVEPNLSLPDRGFGLKLGDTVLCTPDGAESLSTLPHGLHRVPVGGV